MPGVALATLTLGLKIWDTGVSLSEWLKENKDKEPGKLYDRVRNLMDKRAVLGGDIACLSSEAASSRDPVMSHDLSSLRGLFGTNPDTNKRNPSGVVYVLCDKGGNGKSHAGRALLTNFYQTNNGKDIKGIMIEGDQLNTNISDKICKVLKATSVEGWIDIMLLAMDTPPQENPSILIIDGVNSRGPDDVNIQLIGALYARMNGMKNIFVVALTQNQQVAQALIDLNGGQRVKPMPGCFRGQSLSPEWTQSEWTEHQFTELVQYHCTIANESFGAAYTQEQVQSYLRDNLANHVRDQSTPLQVVMDMRASLRTGGQEPCSPRKKRRTG